MSTFNSVSSRKSYRNVSNYAYDNLVATRVPLFATGRRLRRKAYVVALECTPLQSGCELGYVQSLLSKWEPARRFVYAQNRQFLQNASKVIAGSPQVAESLLNDYQVEKRRIMKVW